MASRKLTQLPTATEVTASDKIYIVDVSDTSESPQGTSKQAVISELPSSGITTLTSTDGSIDIDLTDPDAPDLSISSPSIPLAGTAEGAPLTGTIQLVDGIAVVDYLIGDDTYRIGFNDGSFMMTILSADGAYSRFAFEPNGSNIAIAIYNGNTLNKICGIDLFNSDVSIRFTSEKIGFFDKSTTPSTQAAAIADATNATDVITQLNTLLAAMRAYGFIAE